MWYEVKKNIFKIRTHKRQKTGCSAATAQNRRRGSLVVFFGKTTP